MLAGVATLAVLAALLGLLLARVARPEPGGDSGSADDGPVEAVNALLPQIQCARCGHPGCRPYAEAIIQGRADINQCPPGGEQTVHALATLLGSQPRPLDPAFGDPGPLRPVRIDEDACIGCALCLEACPVDAIIGAHRYTHTVLTAECTGCDLCIPACPVNCILPQAADAVPAAETGRVRTAA